MFSSLAQRDILAIFRIKPEYVCPYNFYHPINILFVEKRALDDAGTRFLVFQQNKLKNVEVKQIIG